MTNELETLLSEILTDESDNKITPSGGIEKLLSLLVSDKADTSHTHDDRYYTETEVDNKLSGKSDTSHTHNYLPLTGGELTGDLTAPTFIGTLDGNATSATKLTTSAGSTTQPVYFSNGKPVKCSYTLGKSVPSNAVFTDNNTTYTLSKSGSTIILTGSDGSTSSVTDNTGIGDDIDGGTP
jgi:hypothetical protein